MTKASFFGGGETGYRRAERADLLVHRVVAGGQTLARQGDFLFFCVDRRLTDDCPVLARPRFPDLLVHHENQRVSKVAPGCDVFLPKRVELCCGVNVQRVFLPVDGTRGERRLGVGPNSSALAPWERRAEDGRQLVLGLVSCLGEPSTRQHQHGDRRPGS